jgi:hypothetical protein
MVRVLSRNGIPCQSIYLHDLWCTKIDPICNKAFESSKLGSTLLVLRVIAGQTLFIHFSDLHLHFAMSCYQVNPFSGGHLYCIVFFAWVDLYLGFVT